MAPFGRLLAFAVLAAAALFFAWARFGDSAVDRTRTRLSDALRTTEDAARAGGDSPDDDGDRTDAAAGDGSGDGAPAQCPECPPPPPPPPCPPPAAPNATAPPQQPPEQRAEAPLDVLVDHYLHKTGPPYSSSKNTFEYDDAPPVSPWWEYAQARTEFPNCDRVGLRANDAAGQGEEEDWEQPRRAEIERRRAANEPMPFRGNDDTMLPNLYDVFMWHNELDFLEVRLNELEPVVNGFAVADANLTFTLRPKTSLLTPALLTDPRFSSFADRIVHLSLDISNVSSDDTWERERHTRRESLRSAVERFRPLPGDLFITGDGDEFVRSSTLNRLRRCKGWKSPRTLRSSFFYFSFESRADFDWPGPSLHRHPALPPWPDGESMRVGVDRSPAGERAAGWHCSWCLGSVAALADKMRSYSHTEHDTPHFTDPRHIVSSILLRRDPFDRDGHNYLPLRVPVDASDARGADERLVDMPSYLALRRPPHLVHFWDRWAWARNEGYDPAEIVRSDHGEFAEFERGEKERERREDAERRAAEEKDKREKEEAEKAAKAGEERGGGEGGKEGGEADGAKEEEAPQDGAEAGHVDVAPPVDDGKPAEEGPVDAVAGDGRGEGGGDEAPEHGDRAEDGDRRDERTPEDGDAGADAEGAQQEGAPRPAGDKDAEDEAASTAAAEALASTAAIAAKTAAVAPTAFARTRPRGLSRATGSGIVGKTSPSGTQKVRPKRTAVAGKASKKSTIPTA